MKKEISQRITIFGFVMTCIIVFYHCGTPKIAISSFDEKWNTYLGTVFDGLAVLAMSWFFTITGFLLFYNLTLSNYLIKIKSRMVSLLVPYLLWQIIYVIKSLVSGGDFSGKYFMDTVFLLEQWPPAGQLWYLYAVFLLALLSPIFLLIFKKKKVGILTPWFLVLVIVILTYRIWFLSSDIAIAFRTYGYIPNILMYFPAYIVGAFYGYFVKDGDDSSLKYCVSMIFVAFMFEGLYEGITFDILIRMLPIFILYLFPIREFMVDRKVYKLSFLVYALHQLFKGECLGCIRNFISQIIPYAIVSNVFGRFLYLFVVIGIASV